MEQDDALLLLALGTVGLLVMLARLWGYYSKWSSDKEHERLLRSAKENNAVVVAIEWCGGCGFQEKFALAEKAIKEKFPEDDVKVVSLRNAEVTGNFEVKVGEVLVHSMKTRRDGFL